MSAVDVLLTDQWALYLTDDHDLVERHVIVDVILVRQVPPDSYHDHAADIFHCSTRLPAGRLASRRALISLDQPLAVCVPCSSRITKRESDLQAYREMGGLPSADLYAGGGGTMLGKKGWFRSKLAVDLDGTACATLE